MDRYKGLRLVTEKTRVAAEMARVIVTIPKISISKFDFSNCDGIQYQTSESLPKCISPTCSITLFSRKLSIIHTATPQAELRDKSRRYKFACRSSASGTFFGYQLKIPRFVGGVSFVIIFVGILGIDTLAVSVLATMLGRLVGVGV
ncbi:hypothetical protein HK102_004961 [Quaeritorhiza haematococci]|nr:hypothetical protein HK102_004961 [Quaeritorhiza haematococci]